MILAIDVGNSNMTCALFDGDEITGSFRLTTNPPRTSDEYGIAFWECFQAQGLDSKKVEGAVIASVVPNVMYSLRRGIKKYFDVDPLVVGPGIKTGIRLGAENPKEIGADLIVNAVAVHHYYGGPAIVVDFGTATTYELVLEDGTFDSVVICPGVKISASALFSGTAQLPEFEIKKPKTVLGRNTITALQAGVYYSTIGEGRYIVEAMKKESGLKDAKVIATGGLASNFAKESDFIDITDPMLTLKGTHLIYELNR